VYCVLNNLFDLHEIPDIIASFNTFEKILIQRAKTLQTVDKMGTVINKKLSERQMIQKVKFISFATSFTRNILLQLCNKLCKNTDPININYEMYILVRGIPTKNLKLFGKKW